MKCPHCQNEIEEGATSCPSCDKATTDTVEPQNAPVTKPVKVKKKAPLVMAIIAVALPVFTVVLMLMPLVFEGMFVLFKTEAGCFMWVPTLIAAIALGCTSLAMLKRAKSKILVIVLACCAIVFAVAAAVPCCSWWVTYTLIANL